jgi:hypothetical protein
MYTQPQMKDVWQIGCKLFVAEIQYKTQKIWSVKIYSEHLNTGHPNPKHI